MAHSVLSICDPGSPAYGHITSTPKAGWQNFDLAGTVERALGVPVAFDTDVNAALLGEAQWGAARGLTDAIYITIGTGIGGGAMVNGKLRMVWFTRDGTPAAPA